MVRLSKQTRRRSVSYKRPKISEQKAVQEKTANNTYKNHPNAIDGDIAQRAFIPKIA